MPLTAFVTGTDRGLGQAFVEQLATRRYRIFAGCLELARRGAPPRIVSDSLVELPLDVQDMASIQSAARLVGELSSSLDLLINNAAINPDKNVALENLDFEIARTTLDVNALGPLRVTQQFLPILERGERKTIINISSEAGSLTRCTRTSWFSYCMSKAALNMQTRILHNYLSPRGFRVYSIHPGWIRTTMTSADAPLPPEESAARILDLIENSESELPLYFEYDGREHPW